MALYQKRQRAISLRKQGASYSQIKEEVKVSKSTLSLWLRDMPLSEKRLRALRDFSAVRIEKYRETRRKTREIRWASVRKNAEKEISVLSKRELFLAGLFLYWGEGTKTAPGLVSVSNTDPVMLKFFISWMELLGVPRSKLRVKIHFYRDMNIHKESLFWSRTLGIPLANFRKPYIKDSTQSGLSYPQRFTHGTANVMYGNRDISERVLLGLEHVRSMFADTSAV